MDSLDMREVLLNEFKDDPVFKLCQLYELEDYLFNDSILRRLDTEKIYSTVESGLILGRSDSTIRNHFRTEIIAYVQPERIGKFYRLDYISIFKLHMVFTLMEKTGKGSNDVLVEAGFKFTEKVGSEFSVRKASESNNNKLQVLDETKKLDEILKRMDDQDKNIQTLQAMLNISEYRRQVSEIKNKIEYNNTKIELIEEKELRRLQDEKNVRLVDKSMDKAFEKKGLFGLVKQNKDLDINVIVEDIERQLEEKFAKNIEEQLSEIKRDNQDLNEKLQQLEKLLASEESRLEIINEKETVKIEHNNNIF